MPTGVARLGATALMGLAGVAGLPAEADGRIPRLRPEALESDRLMENRCRVQRAPRGGKGLKLWIQSRKRRHVGIVAVRPDREFGFDGRGPRDDIADLLAVAKCQRIDEHQPRSEEHT